jgi:hypothetical protein
VQRLHSLDPAEVSLVPRGANKRKFLILKSRDGAVPMTKEELIKSISCEPDTMKRVDKILKDFNDAKGMKPAATPVADNKQELVPAQKADEQMGEGPVDEKAQAALKAVVRILTPWKESLSPLLIHEVLDAAGFQMASGKAEGEDMGMKQGSATMSPEPVKEEHKIEAMKIAKDAYKAHLAKLGYQKYPTEEVAQKAVNTDPDEPAEDEEQEGIMHDPAGVQKSAVMKSLIAKLPKEARGAVEMIYKGQLEAVEKAANLEKELNGVLRATRRKAMVEKASSFTNLGVGTEELADTLMAIADKSPEQFEKIENVLKSANQQIGKGSLFAEYGSSQGASRGSDVSWSQIEATAATYVAKTGEKVTKEQATDKFLETAEGKRMYNEYMNGHVSNGRN